MDEVRELREENRHLLNMLLQSRGLPSVGERLPDVHSNPVVRMRARAASIERQRWEEWYGSVAAAQPKTEA
jgi:hypothetical protein